MCDAGAGASHHLNLRPGGRGRGDGDAGCQLLYKYARGPHGPRGQLRRGQLLEERHGLSSDGPRSHGLGLRVHPDLRRGVRGRRSHDIGPEPHGEPLAHGLFPLCAGGRGGKGAERLRRGEAGRLGAVRGRHRGQQRGHHQGLLLHRHGGGPDLNGRPRRRERKDRCHRKLPDERHGHGPALYRRRGGTEPRFHSPLRELRGGEHHEPGGLDRHKRPERHERHEHRFHHRAYKRLYRHRRHRRLFLGHYQRLHEQGHGGL